MARLILRRTTLDCPAEEARRELGELSCSIAVSINRFGSTFNPEPTSIRALRPPARNTRNSDAPSLALSSTRPNKRAVGASQVADYALHPHSQRHSAHPTMAETWETLLEPFKGQQLPEKARTEPHIPQKEPEPMTLAKLWQYVPFLAFQGELGLRWRSKLA